LEFPAAPSGRSVVAFKTRVPAEGVEHQRVEVVAEEAEDQV
jgi:hypothetical protein